MMMKQHDPVTRVRDWMVSCMHRQILSIGKVAVTKHGRLLAQCIGNGA